MFNLFKSSSNTRYEKEFNKIWAERNLDYSEILLKSLEIPHLSVGDYIFIERTKDLEEKLTRIGFVNFIEDYSEKELLDTFSYVMYNQEYNIVLNLYESALKKVVSVSYKIIDGMSLNKDEEILVFVNSIKTLKVF